ncbi:ATP-binding protein [Xanthobacter sp. DSM 24535]|uniref:ATP-binding protein n=1 Tax=Roseixanthobacter psychrophilus TaxID=3119917 RepID=UPI003727D4F5
MAMALAGLKMIKATLPPRVLIYGPPGKGKTTLASEFPNPVFILVEDGLPSGLELAGWDEIDQFATVMEAMVAVLEDDHDFQTLVIDSIDKLEPLLWDHLCREKKWASIEDPGFGKGYIEADKLWREFLALAARIRRERQMGIVFISHSEIGRFDDPSNASYSRYDIRLHKRAVAQFQDEVDAILFLNEDVTVKEEKTAFGGKEIKAKGGGNRWIYTEGRPSFVAKNRYGLPEKFQYKPGEGYNVLAPHFPMPARPALGEATE